MTTSELTVGSPAPDFHALAIGGPYGAGREVSLSELRGKTVVLYFYPKDDTPGCTVQACSLRDHWSDMKTQAEVFGVSTDAADSHQRFIQKFNLPFPLLSDPDHKIASGYGVWVEKKMYGKNYMGTERSTFVINAEGRLMAILRKVKPEQHVDLLQEVFNSAKK